MNQTVKILLSAIVGAVVSVMVTKMLKPKQEKNKDKTFKDFVSLAATQQAKQLMRTQEFKNLLHTYEFKKFAVDFGTSELVNILT